jgi:hypothetical protein
VVGFAGEQRAGFLFGYVVLGNDQSALQFFQKILALVSVGLFGRETDIGFDVAGQVSELFVGVELVFGAFAIA